MEMLIGQKFSQVYLDKAQPTQDSQCFRARLGAYVEHTFSDAKTSYALFGMLKTEIGAEMPMGGSCAAIVSIF
jgi:hypothetical protein